MRIRQWLRRAEQVRRSVVVVEEKSADQLERERRQAADVRHGFLPMAGRRSA